MRIKELREERNLTQNEVANALNTSQRNIGRWETKSNEPTASFIIALANYFQCSTDYLLGRSDELGNITVKKDSSPGLTPEEELLLANFRSLPRPERAQASEYIHFLAERKGNQNKHA